MWSQSLCLMCSPAPVEVRQEGHPVWWVLEPMVQCTVELQHCMTVKGRGPQSARLSRGQGESPCTMWCAWWECSKHNRTGARVLTNWTKSHNIRTIWYYPVLLYMHITLSLWFMTESLFGAICGDLEGQVCFWMERRAGDSFAGVANRTLFAHIP